jgi:aminopeptidase N
MMLLKGITSMLRTDTPKTIFLKDYTPPPYLVRHLDLDFQIYDGKTIVRAITQYSPNNDTNAPLFLNGEHLKLISIQLDGKDVAHEVTDEGIIISELPAKDFTLEIVTEIEPEKNTALEGLYNSCGTYCTQCEAQGFRRITYYQDRPDVMATFRVRVEADKKSCPVLLSNGNLIEQGDTDDGRHFTLWDDPTPKSCYLFALVAGALEQVHDTFTTMSGRKVDLYIYVRKGDEGQCAHAMKALQDSMKWDEDTYGREYQYDLFNIVAVSDFNMGAMENTSLNIFNTALVLAHPDTATDADFGRVESVIAHEYFHNWTGNRVTCRDWFQLSLKEGLTVFRDQEFSADMNSRALQRIDDVQHLRKMQFPEDAGPLAHPIRPDNYIEINNFYTMTVYEKGAEIIRMFHTLLGADTYREATDLYFERFDGMAVTTEDWVNCMEDASGINLDQFKLWYSQAGTPEVTAETSYDDKAKTFTVTFKQTIPDTPGQTNKKPMHIPIAIGLIGPNGDDMIGTEVLHLEHEEQTFMFTEIGVKPVPSILRNFSAPIKLTTDLSDEDLKFLMVHDTDGFNRWESGQTYALRVINRFIDTGVLEEGLLDSLENLLDQALQNKGDKALLARALSLPEVQIVAQTRDVVAPDAIYAALDTIAKAFANQCREKLQSLYVANGHDGPYSPWAQDIAQRSLKNMALGYLDDPEAAFDQYEAASNMTDRVAALSVLKNHEGSYKDKSFADFYERFKSYPLVIDKWFSLQATAVNDVVVRNVQKLSEHKDFTLKNPNRVRSLYGAFAMNNPVGFHAADGSGYVLLRDAVVTLNRINPQIAARMLTPLREWRRYTTDRQAKMKDVLEVISKTENLSPDVFEIVSKSLKG